MGINSEELEVTLIGEAPDMDYLGKLMEMVESLIEKTITWQVCSSGAEIDPYSALLVWQKDDEQ